MPITVQRLFPSGGLRLSAIVADEYVSHRYFFYSRADALADFRAMLRERFGPQWATL